MLFDLPPANSLPTPVEPGLENTPSASLRSMLLPFIRAESTLFVVFFALFLVAAAYQVAGIAYARLAVGGAQERVAELNQAVTPVLEARDAALSAMDSIEEINSLHSGPLQLQYLSDLLAHLETVRASGREIELAAWEYQPGGVSISVAVEELSATELLAVFEDIPWLTEQRVGDDPVKGRMRVTANLVPGWRFPAEAGAEVAGT